MAAGAHSERRLDPHSWLVMSSAFGGRPVAARSTIRHWFSAGLFLLAVTLYLLDLKGAGVGVGALAFVLETISRALDVGAGRDDRERDDVRD